MQAQRVLGSIEEHFMRTAWRNWSASTLFRSQSASPPRSGHIPVINLSVNRMPLALHPELPRES